MKYVQTCVLVYIVIITHINVINKTSNELISSLKTTNLTTVAIKHAKAPLTAFTNRTRYRHLKGKEFDIVKRCFENFKKQLRHNLHETDCD
jgi:hypothetical protein